MQAKVIQYFEDKGYGWLSESVHVRRFFHVRNWESDEFPQIGQLVTYDLAAGNPGKTEQAVKVRPVANETKITAIDLAQKAEPKESR